MLYVAGGMVERLMGCNELWRFSPQRGEWEELAEMPGPPRFDARAASLDGRIYVVGGIRHAGNADGMVIYDTATDRWTQAPPFPSDYYHAGENRVDTYRREMGYGFLRVVAHNGSVVVMGSGPPMVYAPASATWLDSDRYSAEVPRLTLSMCTCHVPPLEEDMHPLGCTCHENLWGAGDEDGEEDGEIPELPETAEEHEEILLSEDVTSLHLFSAEVDVAALRIA